MDESSYPICDNCGHPQQEGEWFTGRGGHWWCSDCNIVVKDREIRGTVVMTCPECGWLLTVQFTEGTASRDRAEEDRND